MMNDNTRRIKLGTIVITVIVIVLVLVTLFGRRSSGQSLQSVAVPATLAQSAAFGTNTLVFSNGQSLSTYNYTNGQEQTLGTSNAGLNTIDSISVSSNESEVLFHDNKVGSGGSLAAQLQSHRLNPMLDYWWLYDVQTSTFQPLPQGIVLAKIYGDNVYAMASGSVSETLTTYSIPSLQSLSTINIPGSINFFVGQNGFLLESPDNKVMLTQDGVVNQVIASSTIIAGLTPDKQWAVGVSLQGSSRQLIELNLQNNTSTTIAPNITIQPVWLDSGEVLYATTDPSNTGDQQLSIYTSTNHKTIVWNLGNTFSSHIDSGTKLNALVGPTTAVISNTSGNYYLIGNNLASANFLRTQ